MTIGEVVIAGLLLVILLAGTGILT